MTRNQQFIYAIILVIINSTQSMCGDEPPTRDAPQYRQEKQNIIKPNLFETFILSEKCFSFTYLKRNIFSYLK